MSKFRDIFKNRNFLLFWIGQIISQFGDRLTQMALIAFVFQRLGSSAFALAKVMSFTIIPSFVISPFAGAFVDRWDHKRTMIAADIIRAVLVVLIPLIFIRLETFIPTYIAIFLIFTASCFFLPSKLSIIPDLVDKEKLLIANSLTNVTIMIAAVLGVGLGGPLIEAVGAKAGFYIDALTYILSAGLLIFVGVDIKKIMPAQEGAEELGRKIEKSIFSDIWAGISYVLRQPYLRFIFFTIFMLMSAAGAIYIVGVVFIQRTFGTATRDLGFLSAFLGAGLFVGALICGRLGYKVPKVKIIFSSVLGSGVFIALFALSLSFYPVVLLAGLIAVFIGFFVGPIFITGNTLIHEVIKPEMRGRIFSSLGIVMNFGFVIFMFVASKLSEFFDPLFVILMISGLFVLYGIAGLLNFNIKR
ncbi:MAG: MFS transporter [Candidatus Omnitrophota bacterium]